MSSGLKPLQSVGATRFGAHDTPNRRRIIEAGAIGALVGGVCIWIHEAIVWVWAQHQMPLIGIPGNATGLASGRRYSRRWAHAQSLEAPRTTEATVRSGSI